MAVGITVTPDLEGLMVEVALTGLVATERYDVMRLQHRLIGTDPDTGTPIYERELPDRPELWSSVAHRVGWSPGKTTATFRDYECPLRPTKWFVVLSSAIGPHEFDWNTGDYDLTRGVLSSSVVHFARDIEALDANPEPGHLVVRSVHDLASFVSLCVVDFDELKYTARGTELKVLGDKYPVFVGDVREARRGTVILKTDTLGAYNQLRSIVFPANGKILPAVFNVANTDPTLLLDDMRIIPLDVSVEQATHSNADLRFIHVDFVEIDGTAPLYLRTGDNDDLVNKPVANFSISNTTPNRNQTITLTETGTGQFDKWTWTITPKPTNWSMGTSNAKGPHKVKWAGRGKKTIKLRLSGPAGAHVKTKTVTVA